MAHRELGHQALARDKAVVLGADATAGMALGIAACRDPARAQTFEAPIDGDLCLRIGVGPGTVVDRDGRFSRRRMQVDFAHRHADFGMQRSGVPDAPGCGQWPGGDAGSDVFPASVIVHGAEPPRLKQKRPSSPYRMEIGRLEDVRETSRTTPGSSAPSLRQCELDQVHRVTALPVGQQYLSPLSGPPG